MVEIEGELKQLQMVSDSVAEYFCEDPNKFKLDDCCSVFNEFCKKFLRAMQVSVEHAKLPFFKKSNPFKVSLSFFF